VLLSLRIKNYALIESEEIEFGSGLNILTGETGAGKSIILGALALALGEKANKEALKNEADEALVEAIFSIDSDEMREKLAELDVETYDDQVILTRKISATRAKAMINGESVPSQKLHMVGSLLLNIFGQHEHQTLLKKEKHMEIIDSFGGAELATLKEKVGECFERYTKLHQEYESMLSENTNREKDLLYLNHEVEEISNANLKEGEDEEVENEYRRMKNSQKIMEAVGEAYSRTSDDGASALLGSALSSLQKALEYDESLSDAYSVLSDADGLLNDFNRLMSDYISEASFDGAYFQEIESRLDLINNLKAKYGPTIEAILEALEEKQKEIEKIENFDGYLEKLKSDLAEAEKEYLAAAENLTKMREISRDNLLEMVRFNLRDLNFTNTEVEMPFERSETFRKNGLDTGELLVSLNAGEPLRDRKSHV
jgi:DNA repair protein RecN (Recombination protein N)